MTRPVRLCRAGLFVVGVRPSAAHEPGALVHFSEVLIEENLVLSLEPIPPTTAMMASAIPAAINPYSIAVTSVPAYYDDMIEFGDPAKHRDRN
jgi:hypothetical protein